MALSCSSQPTSNWNRRTIAPHSENILHGYVICQTTRLAIFLLSIRAMAQEDLGWSVAELTFDTTLQLPGVFFSSNTTAHQTPAKHSRPN